MMNRMELTGKLENNRKISEKDKHNLNNNKGQNTCAGLSQE